MTCNIIIWDWPYDAHFEPFSLSLDIPLKVADLMSIIQLKSEMEWNHGMEWIECNDDDDDGNIWSIRRRPNKESEFHQATIAVYVAPALSPQ